MSLLFLFAFWIVFLTTGMDSRKVVASWGHIWLTHPHCGKKSPLLGLEAWDETKTETLKKLAVQVQMESVWRGKQNSGTQDISHK